MSLLIYNLNQLTEIESSHKVSDQRSVINLSTSNSTKSAHEAGVIKRMLQKKIPQDHKTQSDKSHYMKMKTEVCKNYSLGIVCPYKDSCSFAHGAHELKSKVLVPTKYKTVRCKQFHNSGYCQFGSRCQFLHKEKGKRKQHLPKVGYSQIFVTEISEKLQKKGVSTEQYLDQYWNMDRLKFSKLQVFSTIRGESPQKRL